MSKAAAKSAYAQAGVDIDVKMSAVGSIKQMVAATKTANVLGNIGAFGGLFKTPAGKDQILVASADGVGTKLKVAALMNKHDTVGQDIVNHCVNDILVQGAKPLFFMDYIGTAKSLFCHFVPFLQGKRRRIKKLDKIGILTKGNLNFLYFVQNFIFYLHIRRK